MKLLAVLAVLVSLSTAISLRASRRLIFNNEENRSFKNCGVVSELESDNEHFPWDADIVLSADKNKTCPAMFITKRTLIAHASCAHLEVNKLISIEINLKHSQTKIKENAKNVQHPKFNDNKGQFDFIVINLKMEQNVTPICLWTVPEMFASQEITEYNPSNRSNQTSKIVRTNVCWSHTRNKTKQNLKGGEIMCIRSNGHSNETEQLPFLIKKQENIWYLRGLRRQEVELKNTLSAYNDIVDSIDWIVTSSKYISVLPKQISSTQKYEFKTKDNLSSPNCGLINGPTREDNNEVEPQVAGGQRANNNSHPWYALIIVDLSDKESQGCGGTLIKENVVLTAAHCLFDKKHNFVTKDQVWVSFGITNFYESESTLQPKHIVVHENYGKTSKHHNDIALLIFEEGAITKETKDNTSVSTLCLWNGHGSIDKNTNGTIFGFGYNEKDELPNMLQSIVLPIIQHKECFQKAGHETAFQKYLVPGKSFCAGYLGQNRGTCKGDSGGGLAIEVNGRWFLRGIVSVGPLTPPTVKCNPNYYTIFVDVHHYLQWIEDNSEPKHIIPNAEKLTTFSASEQYLLSLKEIASIFIILICVSLSSVLLTLLCRCQNRSHSERRRFSQTV